MEPSHSHGLLLSSKSTPPNGAPASEYGTVVLSMSPGSWGPRSSTVVVSAPSSLTEPIRRSGDLRLNFPASPVIETVFGLPPEHQTFRAFAALLFRIAVFSFSPGDSVCAYLSSSILTMTIVGKWEPLGISYNPATQLCAGTAISTTHPFALATAVLIARSLG